MKKVDDSSKQNLNPKTNFYSHYGNPSDFLSSHSLLSTPSFDFILTLKASPKLRLQPSTY